MARLNELETRQLGANDPVALTARAFQAFPVRDGHMSHAVIDQPGAAQRSVRNRHRALACPEHLREHVLGHREVVEPLAVMGEQQPQRQTLLRRVKVSARNHLCQLADQRRGTRLGNVVELSAVVSGVDHAGDQHHRGQRSTEDAFAPHDGGADDPASGERHDQRDHGIEGREDDPSWGEHVAGTMMFGSQGRRQVGEGVEDAVADLHDLAWLLVGRSGCLDCPTMRRLIERYRWPIVVAILALSLILPTVHLPRYADAVLVVAIFGMVIFTPRPGVG